jgi:hypothetical protein
LSRDDLQVIRVVVDKQDVELVVGHNCFLFANFQLGRKSSYCLLNVVSSFAKFTSQAPLRISDHRPICRRAEARRFCR